MTQPINVHVDFPEVQRVDVTRSQRVFTRDSLLWEIIKDRTAALSFARYSAFIDNVFSDDPRPKTVRRASDTDPAIADAQAIVADPEHHDADEVDEAQRQLEDLALQDAKFPQST